MMIKKKSNPWARMKYAYVLPLAAVAVAAFARPEVSSKLDEISSVKVNDLTSFVKAEEVKSVENSSDEKIKVSGRVLEEASKKPVCGASIIVKGTTNGTLADKEGKFVLSAKKGDVILVSYIGMQTQSIIVKDATSLIVLMRNDVHNLEEMHVVGYASNGVGTPTEDPEKKVVSVVGIPDPEPEEKKAEQDAVFRVVEQMPEFPGGMGEAMKFLAANIEYPITAQQAKIQGRVVVQFVVQKDGSVSELKVVRGISPELDTEALRVVGMMPKWIPGKQRGKAVAVKYTMPITFRLQPSESKMQEGGFQHVNLKVSPDTDMGTVNSIKDHLRSSVLKVDVETEKSDALTYIVVVDGVEKGFGVEALRKVPAQTIERIEVLSAKNAVVKYGNKAKDGAVEIKTKQNK